MQNGFEFNSEDLFIKVVDKRIGMWDIHTDTICALISTSDPEGGGNPNAALKFYDRVLATLAANYASEWPEGSEDMPLIEILQMMIEECSQTSFTRLNGTIADEGYV